MIHCSDNWAVYFQLQPGRWRRPLTMGYQTSETHEEFRAQPAISEPHDPAYNPRGFLIDGHLKNGPSQVFFAIAFYPPLPYGRGT